MYTSDIGNLLTVKNNFACRRNNETYVAAYDYISMYIQLYITLLIKRNWMFLTYMFKLIIYKILTCGFPDFRTSN